MPRIVLPQNLLLNPGTLMEGFQTTVGWQNWDNMTFANDPAHFREGAQGVKFTGVADSNSLGVREVNLDLSKATTITAVLYIESQAVVDNLLDYGTLRLYLSNDDLSNSFVYWLNLDHRLSPGYNVIRFRKSEATTSGSPNWKNPILALGIRFASFAAGAASVTFCALYADQENVPKVIITADDGDATAYSEIFAYLNPRGMKFTSFVYGSGVGDPGKVSLAQLQEMYNAGCDVGNHSWDHADLTAINLADALANLTTMRNWQLGQGFVRGSEHLAYPYGVYTEDLIAALPGIGIKTGRLANAIAVPYTYPPVENLYLLNVGNPSVVNDLATVKSYVDKAVDRKGTLILLFHSLVAAGPVDEQWLISDFQELVRYIMAKQVDVVTMSEWFAQLKNPRKRIVRLEV
jgi:peptidoglycan/xylan/chitin deacetylase (PgdA/CDA1 family)